MKDNIVGILGMLLVGTVVVFLISPLCYYWGEWNSFWSEPSYASRETSSQDKSTEITNWDGYVAATDDCENRAARAFGPETPSFSSSTGDGSYTTYDCYGIKATKL